MCESGAAYGADGRVSSDRNGTLSEAEEAHMTTQVPCLWVGIDAGEAHHCWVAIDDAGSTAWSRKVSNAEAVILAGLNEVLALAGEVRWAVDLTGTAPR